MPARTERRRLARARLVAAVLLFAGATSARAEDAWVLEEARFRFAFFHQEGRGFQSQDGPLGGPGSQRLFVAQPMMLFGLRQNERVRHTVTIPIDIVTSASSDALDMDAMTSASKTNEAFQVDITSTIDATEDDQVSVRYAIHIEEPFRSGTVGLGYARALADRNAMLTANASFTPDVFDPLTHTGNDLGLTSRFTFNWNLGFSQVLSRTTLASVSYGSTFQRGTLAQTWNAVPTDACPAPPCLLDERFPETRLRHAFAFFVAQHVPFSRTTLRARYRYYLDSVDLRAHTAELEVFQYLGRWLRLGASYRYYRQTAVDFFTTSAADTTNPRTSDSDLAAFHANEGSVRLLIRTSPDVLDQGLELSYLRYQRSSGPIYVDPGTSRTLGTALRMDMFALSYAQAF